MPDKKKVASLLNTEIFGRELFFFERIDSTNKFLKQCASKSSNGAVAMADEQLEGQGRQGKKWHSSSCTAVLMSLLIKPVDIVRAPALTLLCGLAVAKTLNSLCGGGFAIKWPNDIVSDGKKVAGILCEAKLARGCAYAVCGIGINLMQESSFFEDNSLNFGTSVKMLKGSAPTVEQAAAGVINTFETIYKEYLAGREKNILEEYSSICITLGSKVCVQYKDKVIIGTATKISPSGSLSIDTGSENIAVNAGEVSVRGIMGYV